MPLEAYYRSRPITAEDRLYVRRVIAAVLMELDDNGNVSEMFPEYGIVISFILANRRIRSEITEIG